MRPVLLALLAGGWIVAAVLLWQTSVPGLDLPDVELREHFTASELADAERIDRFFRLTFALSLVATLVVLALYAAFGARFARESAAGRIGTGMLLGMLGLGLVWFAAVPFEVADLWWARRNDLAEDSYVELVLGSFLALGGEFLFISFALLVVMGLARLVGERWWIPGAAVFAGLVLLFTFVAPYLLPGQERLDDPQLVADARRAAFAQGAAPVPVYVLDIPGETEEPNAGAVGLGPTRRILVWDSLLAGDFDAGELFTVLAHETAHHARDHLWKSVAWFALFALPGALVIARVARRRGGMADPRAVPLVLFVFVLLTTAALPLDNAFSRRMEAEADWVALETTSDPDAARRLFEDFSTLVHTDPSPPTWAFVLAQTHPTLEERLAMVDAWEAEQGR
jgi:STE24 endopeptidase